MESPVRDTEVKTSMRSAVNRKALSKMDRQELEDRYVSIFDENIVLKKYGRKRDEDVKRLSTIQTRLEQDRRRLLADANGLSYPESHYTEQLALQQEKIRSLEKNNEQLKAKLSLQKEHTSIAQYAGNTAYAYVGSRVNSGVVKHEIDPELIRNIKMVIQPKKLSSTKLKGMLPKPCKDIAERGVGTSPELDAKSLEHQAEIEKLMQTHDARMSDYETIISRLQQKMEVSEQKHQDEVSLLRSNMQQQQQQQLQQQQHERVVSAAAPLEGRENREKEAKFNQLLDQFQSLEQKSIALKKSNEDAVLEIESLNRELKEQRDRFNEVSMQLQQHSGNHYAVDELETQVRALQRECLLLKESNNNLVQKALETRSQALPPGRIDIDSQKRETSLRIQLAQMEAAMKAELLNREDLLEKMTQERREKEDSVRECEEVKRERCELQKEMEAMREKAALFDDNSGVLEHGEFIEALALVKARKAGNTYGDFHPPVPSPSHRDEIAKEVREVKCQLKDAIDELEKTRKMLLIQHRLNKDYQAETELVTRKMESSKREMQCELDRYAQLLDIRAERIRKLESQLKDIAYGTRAKFSQDLLSPYSEQEDEPDPMLQNGQNLFEIHIKQAELTEEGVTLLRDPSPSLFLTQEFYDFQLQTTSVMVGPRPEFDFTSHYIVAFDDFFIHYLHKDTCLMELHHGIGEEYKTFGRARVSMKGVMEEPGGRLHGRLEMKGVSKEDADVTYAHVDYWMRLKVPMQQALRQYRERCKALGYIESNLGGGKAADNNSKEGRRSASMLKTSQQLRFAKIRQQQSKSLIPLDESLERSQEKPETLKESVALQSPSRALSLPPSASTQSNLPSQRLSRLSMRQSSVNQEASLEPLGSRPRITLSQFTLDSSRSSIYKIKNNSLEIIIIKCLGLLSVNRNALPSAYVVYKFFNFPDHVTPTIANTRNPAFDDVCSFSVSMNKSLTYYLKGEEMKIFVIDFLDPEQSSYLGEASVPLSPLTQNNQYKKTFPILDAMGENVGLIEVMFTWKEDYVDEFDDDNEPERKAKIRWKERSSSSTRGMPPTPTEKLPQKPLLKRLNRKPPQKIDSFEEDDADDDLNHSHINDELEGVEYPWSQLGAQLDYPGASQNSQGPFPKARQRSEEKSFQSEASFDYKTKESSNTSSKEVPFRNRVLGEEASNGKARESENLMESVTESSIETSNSEYNKTSKGVFKNGRKSASLASSFRKSQSIALSADGKAVESDDNNNDTTENLTQDNDKNDNNNDTNENLTQDNDKKDSNNSNDNNNTNNRHTISIKISHVRLSRGSPVLADAKTKMLYVAYQFLGEPPEQTETPTSLPKPSLPDVPIHFDFTRDFEVDAERNERRRNLLREMLNQQEGDLSSIKFTLISEPQNDDEDCEDIGVARVDLREILLEGRDVEEEEVPILSETEGSTLGYMGLTVKCLQTLKSLLAEEALEV